MRKTICLFTLVGTILSVEAQVLTSDRSAATNVTVVSESELLRARKFFPLMRDEEGELCNDGGLVGAKIETDAIDEVANAAAELSEAAHSAMTNAMGYVYEAMKDMARDSVGIAMAFAPEGEPSNLTVYVAHEKTNGTNDTMYIWFSEELVLAPNLFVAYEYYGGCVTQKVNWSQGWSTVTNITDNRERVWEGCHIGTVERPVFAINVTCITEPNIPIGGPGGMSWGGITLIDASDSQPYFTGIITNTIDKLLMQILDGAILAVWSPGSTVTIGSSSDWISDLTSRGGFLYYYDGAHITPEAGHTYSNITAIAMTDGSSSSSVKIHDGTTQLAWDSNESGLRQYGLPSTGVYITLPNESEVTLSDPEEQE